MTMTMTRAPVECENRDRGDILGWDDVRAGLGEKLRGTDRVETDRVETEELAQIGRRLHEAENEALMRDGSLPAERTGSMFLRPEGPKD